MVYGCSPTDAAPCTFGISKQGRSAYGVCMSDLTSDPTFHGDDQTLKQDLDKLAVMKAAFREAQTKADRLKEDHDAYEQHLYDRMDAEDTWSIKTSKHRFSGKSTTFATITDMDELREWLEENGLIEECIKEAPQKARLNELVREYLDNGQTLPPGTSSYDRRYISITNIEEN